MVTPLHRSSAPEASARLIHRDILRLGALVIVAVAAFVGTRAVALNNRQMSARDAAEWYARGERQLASGAVQPAIVSLRRATAKQRGNTRYVLELARALALGGHDAAARAALLEVRESQPDDADVNLQLARLAAKRHEVDEASRYYHNALYAPSTADRSDARRELRLELAQFLLDSHEKGRALSELMALAADLPESASWHLKVGQLWSDAGEDWRALSQYEEALRIDPENGQARAGAGEAAFRLGDYARAQRYLRHVRSDDPTLLNTATVVDLILSSDPLAARIGRTERRRRMSADFAYARERFSACAVAPTDEKASGSALAGEVDQFASELAAPQPMDADTIEAGVDLVYRLEQEVVQRCPPPAPKDRALLLIGRRHGAAER